MAATELTTHQQLTENKYDNVNEDDSDSSISDTFGSFSTHKSRELTGQNRNIMSAEDILSDRISGNPKYWDWEQVKLWLEKKSLSSFLIVFDVRDPISMKQGISGEDLLDITVSELFDESKPYKAGSKLAINEDDADNAPLIEKLFREITKLQLRAHEDVDEYSAKETGINDLIEMRRRIHLFINKWDKILWIDHYVDTQGMEPSAEIVAEELGLSISVSAVYIEYYHNIDRIKKKDLAELLMDFNVYADAVIWWFIIISSLKTYPSKSMWLIFRKVAEFTPGSVAIGLLEKYRFVLTRFNSEKLDKVCQSIVIGSQYPVCAALRIAKWFNDRAAYDVARGELFANIADSYVEAAMDYISLIESDHLATVLLEVKSDIEGLSALGMALKYKLGSFVANNRVERVTTSIMNKFEFLTPHNRNDAFQIDPLSLKLIWKKMFSAPFYLTPLGSYITGIVLYICYLALFTYLSVQKFRVYDDMDLDEIIFWIFNIGYAINEFQQMVSTGFRRYFSDPANYFDALVSIVFIVSLIMRVFAVITGPQCTTKPDALVDCWHDRTLNTVFIILWAIATITLWLRLVNFCVLSHDLGPMVQMIFRMLNDILTFFEIMLILFFGFTFALVYILGDTHPDFSNTGIAAITLFTGILGEFDFDAFVEDHNDDNTNLLYFAYALIILYLVIGSLVLLNLLIAMMATTYDNIQKNTTEAITFARFELALQLDNDASFMPPPLNMLVLALLALFYVIEWVINIFRLVACKPYYHLTTWVMPTFMRERKLALNEEILYENCHKYWAITTNRGATVCQMVRYKPQIMQHYVKFYEKEKELEIYVSIKSNVQKKHIWLLDLMNLYECGLMDLEQFENVKCDQRWIQKAHRDMDAAKNENRVSPFFICGHCRTYVKESKVSIKNLGRFLNVNDIELKLITKASPVVCPNCYRVRFDRHRWELIWEILSIWTFYVVVFPIFFVFFGAVLMIRNLLNPHGLGRDWEAFRTDGFVGCCAKKNATEIDPESDESDDEDEGNQNYCIGHYKDTQLIHNLNALSSSDNKLFDAKVRDSIWSKLYDAKGAIDPFLLSAKISRHIMAISSEDELTPYEFFDDYVNKDTLTRNGGDFLWNEYFKPLSMNIFNKIQKLRYNYLPLQLFARYPFSVDMILNDFEQFFDQSTDHNKKLLKQCSKKDLVDALDHLRFLNCIDRKQRQFILDSIEENTNEYKAKKEKNNTIYHKFVKYLCAVASLFQDNRKIKNMLRDVSAAIVERGADASLFSDQLYFLFDDINNSIVSMAFFNSMRTEMVGDSLKVELWTIRNSLQSLYFLNHAARKYTLQQHSRIYVCVKELLDIIFKLYSNDISDPEGITKYIETDEDGFDDFEEKEDDGLINVGSEVMAKSVGAMYGQKSLLALSPYRLRGDTDDDHENDDNKTEQYEKEEEERTKVTQSRMELFHKQEITASAIKTEVTSIFKKLQKRRANKITETTIDFYRRKLSNCRLLQDDESLRYIFEQLSRFAVFNPSEMKKECTLILLQKILCDTLAFNDEYKIDEQTIPKMVRNNENYIKQLYDHLVSLYNSTSFNSIIMEQTLSYMTLEDVLSIIMLYERIFGVMRQKIIDSADDFVVNHDRFCKFVDPKFNMDETKLIYQHKWSDKTKAASNLFQSVLDIQQNFVTLGQIRQTVDALLSDVHAMECGELIRIINHLSQKVKLDNQRCVAQRKMYNLEKPDTFNQVSVELGGETLNATDENQSSDQVIDSKRSLQEIKLAFNEEFGNKKASGKRRKNPSLQFQHVQNFMWLSFIRHISESFKMNLMSKSISDKLKNKSEPEAKYDDDEKNKGKKIIDTILEETEFDIICVGEEKEEKQELEKHEEKQQELKKMRLDVFDTILSFNSRRITLQQLFKFTRNFRAFLRKNKKINAMMRHYDQILTQFVDVGDISRATKELKKEGIDRNNFVKFQNEYFGEFVDTKKFKLVDFAAEIEWLYAGIENKYDICHRLYPFWGNKFINDIYQFMESTEQIQGIYELKCAEFGQLKYSLNVNDDSANKLFHIIRFKNRSLSWKQFYIYFKFLLKIKYNVQKAILKSKQSEDSTISADGMKILLEISLNDESEWLFGQVITMNATKVTWGQIRNYLKKMVAVRDDVREFFGDKERDRHYKHNKAEIIDEISKNIKENKENNYDKQQLIIDTLNLLRTDIEQLKKQSNVNNQRDVNNQRNVNFAP